MDREGRFSLWIARAVDILWVHLVDANFGNNTCLHVLKINTLCAWKRGWSFAIQTAFRPHFYMRIISAFYLSELFLFGSRDFAHMVGTNCNYHKKDYASRFFDRSPLILLWNWILYMRNSRKIIYERFKKQRPDKNMFYKKWNCCFEH